MLTRDLPFIGGRCDDRRTLDRLTERHEALTESVQLLLHESQGRTRQMIEQTYQITQHTAQIIEHTAQINEHTRQVEALRDASAAILQIVQLHENRISGLEGQP